MYASDKHSAEEWFCATHCEKDDCALPSHAAVREIKKSRKACLNTQYDCVEAGHLEKCPMCDMAVKDHPRGVREAKMARVEGGGSSSASSSSTSPKAEDYGLDSTLWPHHPISWTAEFRKQLLALIKDKSTTKKQLDRVKRDLKEEIKGAAEGAEDEDTSTVRSTFYMLQSQTRPLDLRALAGLLAIRAALEELARRGDALVLQRSDVVEGATGTMTGGEATSEALATTKESLGRRWLQAAFEKLSTRAKSDCFQYVKMSKKDKSKRTRLNHVDRYVRVIMGGYTKHLAALPSDHVTPSFDLLIAATWVLPVRDLILPIDLRPMFVQVGIAVAVKETGSEAASLALAAMEANLAWVCQRFYDVVVLSKANLIAHKEALDTRPPPPPPPPGGGGGGGSPRGGGGGGRGGGDGRNSPRGGGRGAQQQQQLVQQQQQQQFVQPLQQNTMAPLNPAWGMGGTPFAVSPAGTQPNAQQAQSQRQPGSPTGRGNGAQQQQQRGFDRCQAPGCQSIPKDKNGNICLSSNPYCGRHQNPGGAWDGRPGSPRGSGPGSQGGVSI